MVFKEFKGALSKQFKAEWTPQITSSVFKLHYKFTYRIFMVSVVLTTIYDVIGDKIKCIPDKTSIKTQSFVENYCFIMGTFTIDHLHNATIGVDVPHPGVGQNRPGDAITVHSYYQWVPYALFANGILFFIPHWIWKTIQGATFKSVIQKLSIRECLKDELRGWRLREQQYGYMSYYLLGYMREHLACRYWFFKFVLCESLNLVVVISTLFFTDHFLGGEFLTYGSKVFEYINMDPEDRLDPMSYVFPRMAKCTYRLWGPSGTIVVRDVMCLIATNIINEKIYVFLWVWLVFLTTVTSLWLVWRILILALPVLRSFILSSYASTSKEVDRITIMSHCTISEWFFIIHLGKDMENKMFNEFIAYLAKEIEKGPHPE
ncbi:unnamed protein product, partial [Meganyctiphanes norvegica]